MGGNVTDDVKAPEQEPVPEPEPEPEPVVPLHPLARIAAFLGGRVSGGKDRRASRQAKGSAPHVPAAVSRTLAAGDHRKARDRKAGRTARRGATPHVKRHARSRAHRGHGKD